LFDHAIVLSVVHLQVVVEPRLETFSKKNVDARSVLGFDESIPTKSEKPSSFSVDRKTRLRSSWDLTVWAAATVSMADA